MLRHNPGPWQGETKKAVYLYLWLIRFRSKNCGFGLEDDCSPTNLTEKSSTCTRTSKNSVFYLVLDLDLQNSHECEWKVPGACDMGSILTCDISIS